MSALRPWDTGDSHSNWAGYFIPGTAVLRNRVGCTTAEELSDAENDLVEVRVAELRDSPNLVARTSDLRHLQALHQFLFQDVYLWAGELRTVGIEKEGESFIPPRNIARPVSHAATRIAESRLLRYVTAAQLPGELAYLCDYINFAHPFREGNGRTQREFFDQLLSESERGLAWNLIDKTDLHDACHAARADGQLGLMRAMFAKILDDQPAYTFGTG